MKLYKRIRCSECNGKKKIYRTGYTIKDCVLCDEKGFIFEHVDPASLPNFPVKERAPIRKRGRPKGRVTEEASTFGEFVQESAKEGKDK